MHYSELFSQVNWLAIVVATLSTFPVGYLWYDLRVFGKKWAEHVGLSNEDMNNTEGMAMRFGMMAFVSLLTAIFISMLMMATGINGAVESLTFGILVGGLLRGGAHVIHNGFAHRSMTLTLIDLGHDLVSIAVMSLIIGIWK